MAAKQGAAASAANSDEGRWRAVGVLDAQARWLFLAPFATRLFGSELRQLLGQPFAEMLTMEARRELARAFASDVPSRIARVALRGEPPHIIDVRLSTLEGVSEGGVLLEASTVTEPLRPQAREGKARAPVGDPEREGLQYDLPELQAVLSALPDLYFRFDAEGRFTDYSAPSSSELFVPPAAFLGKRPIEVMPLPLAVEMERVRAQAHASGSLATIEYELEIGGERKQFEARYVPFLDGQTMAIVRSITDRHRAEKALRESEARLRDSQKLEAVGRLAGGVAHDFNNVLLVISGYTFAISQHTAAPHPAADAVEELRKAVERASALTKQLLALSRQRPAQPVILDPGAVLQDMHRLLERVMGERIALTIRIEPGLSCVRVDRSRLEQIILNLALNARDAMPGGGQLHLVAESAPSEPADSSPRVLVRVSDTGSGMSADTRARIFEPFFTTKAYGTGLGLYMVRNIARESGGDVHVASAPGAGTTVSVSLPAMLAAREDVAREPEAPLARGTETILLVEDQSAVRKVLAEQLRELGFCVIEAEGGAQALETMTREPAAIDLVLTDVVMPGLLGWELGAKIAELAPRCRVLYMSGHIMESEGGASSRVAPDLLLDKPFTLNTLAARIRQLLDRA